MSAKDAVRAREVAGRRVRVPAEEPKKPTKKVKVEEPVVVEEVIEPVDESPDETDTAEEHE
jgi:hypothetical protein